MAMKVAVVGATGFIGQSGCAALLPLIDELVAVRAPRLRAPGRSIPELKEALACSPSVVQLERAFTGCDAVLNTAGIADAGCAGDALYGANALLPAVIQKAAISAGVPRFVHVSSAGVQAGQAILNEAREYAPISPYTSSKMFGESLLDATAGTVIYRPTSVHGVGRGITKRLWRFARSPFSSVAGPGDQPTPQALVASVASVAAHLVLTRSKPPTVVLHPYEGTTTAGVLRDLGGREPLHVPTRMAQAVVRAGSAITGPPRWVANNRRLEMLWFGQNQPAASWLLSDGWSSRTTNDDWQQLARDLTKETA